MLKYPKHTMMTCHMHMCKELGQHMVILVQVNKISNHHNYTSLLPSSHITISLRNLCPKCTRFEHAGLKWVLEIPKLHTFKFLQFIHRTSNPMKSHIYMLPTTPNKIL